MTKKQTEVNDQNAENAAAAEAPVTTEEQTAAEAGEEAEEEAETDEEVSEEPVAEEAEVDDSEPAPPPAAHGTHNAAVNGLQTSPGYDSSKL